MKVILNYDPTTGNVTDNAGLYIGCNLCLSFDGVDNKKNIDVNEIIKLKEAGFTTEEIAHLRDRGMI